jgi:hypothetical protein
MNKQEIIALIISIAAILLTIMACIRYKRNENHRVEVMKLQCRLESQKYEDAERLALLDNHNDDHTDDIDMMDTVIGIVNGRK